MTDPGLNPPEYGGRILAKLTSGAALDAVYALSLTVADARWELDAKVRGEDGHIDAERLDSTPPWLAQAAHALLRGAWQRRRAGGPWPRRLSRWRPAPEADGA